MVLGYPFLLKHQPDIDWKTRVMRFVRRCKEHFVQGMPGPLPEDLLTQVVEFKDPEDLDASSLASTSSTCTENGSTIETVVIRETSDDLL